MNYTRSGDYKLPTPLYCFIGNLLLRAARCVPAMVRTRFLRRHSYYQVFDEAELGDRQGLSLNKWKAMQMPSSLSGKSVLDIGCADGFFCQLCARNGARSVMGMDSALGRLLRARFVALEEDVSITYRLDIFPSPRVREKYDYVLCLSVLHHSFTKKDAWKVLVQDEFADDLAALRQNLKALRALTAEQGRCVIEMPYEYDDPAERQQIDFQHFNTELTRAGFSRARCLGDWDHNAKYKERKDRIIYVAEG